MRWGIVLIALTMLSFFSECLKAPEPREFERSIGVNQSMETNQTSESKSIEELKGKIRAAILDALARSNESEVQ